MSLPDPERIQNFSLNGERKDWYAVTNHDRIMPIAFMWDLDGDATDDLDMAVILTAGWPGFYINIPVDGFQQIGASQ